MPVKINYKAGDMIGTFIYLEERAPRSSPSGGLQRVALFQCLCQKEFECRIQSIKMGVTKSCGCLSQKLFLRDTRKRTLHKEGTKAEHNSWCAMIARCYNVNNNRYKNYGAVGITVCDRWLDSFQNFYEDMGPKPSKEYSIDRINTSGNYSLDNCRWNTPKEQARNRNTSKLITYKGQTKCLAEWSEELNISHCSILARLGRGWSVEKTLETPLRPCKKGNERKSNDSVLPQ